MPGNLLPPLCRDVTNTVRVASIHDFAPSWAWIEPLYEGSPEVEWSSIATQRSSLEARVPGLHVGRIKAAIQLRTLLKRNQVDLIVSHGPYTSLYIEMLARGRTYRHVPHLAFAFNFTDLPAGLTLGAMREAFSRIDRFVVYSRMERRLYSDTFGIAAQKFEFLRWGVAPPIREPGPREIAHSYIAALGGEARDYATLCAAAARLPNTRFVLILRPDSLTGIDVPENVTVYSNLPWHRAWSIIWYADLVALPLRSKDTPNGHVTAVGAMHLGKAQVITDSTGIQDYFADRKNALLVPPQDPDAMAKSIEQAERDILLRQKLGENAKAFAAEYCSEKVTVDFFRAQIVNLFGTRTKVLHK